jgi:hypothetical protein
MIIPKGKQIIIMTEGGTDLFDRHNSQQSDPSNLIERVPLLLNSDVTINLSSTFSTFLGNFNINKSMAALMASFTAIRNSIGSGSFKQLGMQTWEKTEPISIQIEVKLTMKTNAKRDVYDPAKILMKLSLPTVTSATGGLIPPGPTIASVVEDTAMSLGFDMAKATGNLLDRGTIYSIFIGRTIYLSQCIIKSVVPTFSIETDSNNYPTSCLLSIGIDSILTAHSGMIDDMDSAGGVIL